MSLFTVVSKNSTGEYRILMTMHENPNGHLVVSYMSEVRLSPLRCWSTNTLVQVTLLELQIIYTKVKKILIIIVIHETTILYIMLFYWQAILNMYFLHFSYSWEDECSLHIIILKLILIQCIHSHISTLNHNWWLLIFSFQFEIKMWIHIPFFCCAINAKYILQNTRKPDGGKTLT